MKRLSIVAILLVVISILAVACAPSAPAPATSAAPKAPTAQATATAAPRATAVAKPAWQEKWEAIQDGAKKEGTVVIWSGAPGWRNALTQAFQDRYGIKAEFVLTGKSAEENAKLLAERRAGLYSVDLDLRGVSSPMTVLKPAGVLDSLDPILVLPEVTDPNMWLGGKLPFVDNDHTVMAFFSLAQPTLTVNTDLVKPEDVQSYNDLLNPKWKGKIVLNDPTTSGAGAYIGLIADPLMGSWDYLRNLAKNEPIVLRDQRLQLDWLAHGRVAMSVMTPTDPLVEFMKAGAPIRVVHPKEGTFTSAGWAGAFRINKSPHPNAGALFINWLLSKEGVTVAAKAMGYPSSRVDVPTDFVNPVFVPDPKVKYYKSDNEDYAFRQAEDLKKQREIFGALLK